VVFLARAKVRRSKGQSILANVIPSEDELLWILQPGLLHDWTKKQDPRSENKETLAQKQVLRLN
jgi:hypothetical protein